MASAAQSAKYLAKAKRFAAKLKKYGHEVSLGNLAPGPTQQDPPGAYVETEKTFVLPSKCKADFGNDVKVTDRFYFVGFEVDLNTCKEMQVGGKVYRIKNIVEEFAPDNITTIYYEIQVRL